MFLLRSDIMIPIIAIPTVIVTVIQILLCRFAKKPFTCTIPFITILCASASVLVFVISGMMSDIYEGILTLFILEAITGSLLGDIVGWIIGLAFRGYAIVKKKESCKLSNEVENITEV